MNMARGGIQKIMVQKRTFLSESKFLKKGKMWAFIKFILIAKNNENWVKFSFF